jgi:hypothetical protein
MKVIDKTPLQNEKGEMTTLQRMRGTLEHGLTWYPELEAQKAVMIQLDRILEKGFTLVRNVTLAPSPIVEPLILIGPPGIYVIHVAAITGFYEAKGDQWNIVKSGHAYPAPKNLMTYVHRLARALQVYLDRQGVSLPGPVEPVLVAASPALHIDSMRPMVRVVLSDAVRQFAASLLQARPVLKPELAFDIAERIVTPRPKAHTEPEDVKTPEYIPPSLQDPEQPPESEHPAARARAIFHAAEQSKPFDPADLEFAFDETADSAEAEVPADLREPNPSQRLPAAKRGPLSSRQWILLGGMVFVECCVLASFAYLLFTSTR